MKQKLVAAVIFFSTIAAPGAMADINIYYQGDMYITSTSGCSSINSAVGDFGQAVYDPAGSHGQGTSDRLSLISSRGSALQLTPYSGTSLAPPNTNTMKLTVTTINHLAVANQTTFSAAPFKVSITPLTSTTPAMATISGTVNNFFVSGCTVTLKGILISEPAGQW